jgi:hypothetical protein
MLEVVPQLEIYGLTLAPVEFATLYKLRTSLRTPVNTSSHGPSAKLGIFDIRIVFFICSGVSVLFPQA